MGKKLEPGSARARAAQAKADKILAAARALFAEDGYEHVTIRMIAARARCSTGAIFNKWPDKASIFFDAIGRRPVREADGAEYRGQLALVYRATANLAAARLRSTDGTVTNEDLDAFMVAIGIKDPAP